MEEISGGRRRKSMKIPAYKKYLEKMTVEKLKKSAAKKGIKITKKKDGKTVYLKKATLVKKICDAKHGKRITRHRKGGAPHSLMKKFMSAMASSKKATGATKKAHVSRSSRSPQKEEYRRKRADIEHRHMLDSNTDMY